MVGDRRDLGKNGGPLNYDAQCHRMANLDIA